MTVWRNGPVSRRTLLLAGAASLVGRAGAAEAQTGPGDWPCFRGPNGTGVVEERLTLQPSGPVKLWEAEVGHGNASLAVAQGKVWTFSTAHGISCLDAATGRPVWRRKVETHFGDSTPAVEKERLYALASFGTPSGMAPVAYCCSAATGEILWRRELPKSTGDRQYGHAGSPLLWEDLILFNAGGGVALRKSGGEVAWQHPGFPGLATPVPFQWQGRPSMALFGGDRLVARDARTGRELWRFPGRRTWR